MRRACFALGLTLTIGALLRAQAAPVEFDVVSIKRSPSDASGNSLQTLPDGSFIMRNGTIRSILLAASPVPTREVEGYPPWVESERYDLMAKAPAGSTRQQTNQMMQRMFADRMKLTGHVEQRERNGFALVLARSDGRLGPQLAPSTLDCLAPRTAGPPTGPPTEPPETRCGGTFGGNRIVSGGIMMDQLVPSLAGLAGGQVVNRTGLPGFYALTLRWASRRPTNADAPPDDLPEFFTAIEEQLGLKLRPEKLTLPVFVVHSIERPSEN
jgi:uncharacterized protein (TIGR03435 family)